MVLGLAEKVGSQCYVLNGMDLINNEFVPLGVYRIKT